MKLICLPIVAAISTLLSSSAAEACSCVTSKEKASEVREWIGQMLEASENVVLLRAVEVATVGENHQQATLRVVKSWKGSYENGRIVRSDTAEIGWGMCNMAIDVGQEILVSFDSEPIVINGCPESFVLTTMERRYLDRLAPRARRNAAKQARGAVPSSK